MRAAADPLGEDEFAAAMAALGPFEPTPHVAVAVSGGADSLAAASLTARWLATRGGRGTALTVDHGLRPASAPEAGWVAAMAEKLGLAHRTLHWRRAAVEPPSEARARAARYRLLDEACGALGCLHLVVAHHADDVAQTIAMRGRRGAGPGLAGIAAVRELDHARILRPLLAQSPARLRATAAGCGFGWIEDPTNRDPRVERTRTAPAVLVPGAVAARVAARVAAEREDAAWFARHAERTGAALALDAAAFMALPAPVAARRLAAAAAHVGGAPYVPSPERTAGVVARLHAGVAAATLAGARMALRNGRIVVTAEVGRRPGIRALAPAPFAAPHVVSDEGLLIC